MAGAPQGNQNAKKAKEFEGALRRALAKDDWKRLNEGCEKASDAFANGEPWAIQFVADRLDGKVKQQIEATGVDDGPLLIKIVSYAGASGGSDPTPQV